jgi:hypothetical protein
MVDELIHGLVWSLALWATVVLGFLLVPSLAEVVGELGYWTLRLAEWIVELPSRVLARARGGR